MSISPMNAKDVSSLERDEALAGSEKRSVASVNMIDGTFFIKRNGIAFLNDAKIFV